MRYLVNPLFAISFLLNFVVGPHVSAEIEHSHDGPFDHAHHQAGMGAGHTHEHPPHDHDHGDDHGDDETPPHEPGGGPSESPGPSHSHHVSLGVDLPIASFGTTLTQVDAGPNSDRVIPRAESCPDGPYFELIKPPQLV